MSEIRPNYPASIYRLSGLSWPNRWRIELPYTHVVGAQDRVFYCSVRRLKRRHDRRLMNESEEKQ